MHPYLTRLGVPPVVQDFFEPYYTTDNNGNLVFSYGEQAEHFGFAFHRVPAQGLWSAGNANSAMIRQVFYCDSAMEAISFLSLNYSFFNGTDQLLFLAGGASVRLLNSKAYSLVFGKDILGRVRDLKIAAAIRRLAITIKLADQLVHIRFREKDFVLPQETFSLNAFGKLSGYHFGVRVCKPKKNDCWLDQLKTTI